MLRTEIKKRPMADTVLASLEPEAKEYRENDGNGLYFRVKPDGSKSWQLRYKKQDGKWGWLGLGGYGKGSHQLTGVQARREAEKIRLELSAGENPLITKRARKIAEAEASKNTFEHLALEWHNSKLNSWAPSTARKIKGVLEKHVFPAFGNRPYSNILPMEWMELLRGLEKKGIFEQVKRIRTSCRDIYDLAKVTGRVQHNPLEGLHKHLQSKKAENYAHVSLEELPPLLRAIRSYRTPDISIALQLLSMLACRPSELREARWSEFDLDAGLWLIPAERMKRRREHLIPLPKQAIELLKQLQESTGAYPLLFIGRSDTSKPRSDTVFLMALRRLGYQGRQTPHGFRHLASTILNENGFNPEHIEAQLSHVKGGVRGVYDKSTYLEQRKQLLQWYADHLDILAAGNVVNARFGKVV